MAYPAADELLDKLPGGGRGLDEDEAASYDFTPLVGNDGDEALHLAGYTKPADVREASDEELLEVDGIGPAKLEKLRSL